MSIIGVHKKLCYHVISNHNKMKSNKLVAEKNMSVEDYTCNFSGAYKLVLDLSSSSFVKKVHHLFYCFCRQESWH